MEVTIFGIFLFLPLTFCQPTSLTNRYVTGNCTFYIMSIRQQLRLLFILYVCFTQSLIISHSENLIVFL